MTDARIRFTFDGHEIAARPGTSLAAALVAARVGGLRETASGAMRSVFCGMGVCQDCLVDIEGIGARRACMTPATPGLAVRRLDPRPQPVATGTAAVETLKPDILIVGGGAGGLEAAIAAASVGARVLVVDERPTPGGQYFKQASSVPALDAQQRAGSALLDRARDAGATLRGGVEVWGAFADGDGRTVLAAAEGDTPLVLRPRATVIATGAYERPRLVPGWHLPGVMTTGAAQTLWRSYRVLPGRRVVVAGSGPLNFQVALELARGGVEVKAVVEGAPRPTGRSAAAAAMFAADPGLAMRGAAMLAALVTHGVPLRYGSLLDRIETDGDGLAAIVDGPRGPERIVVDAVLMNEGFEPSNELLRLIGCRFDWDDRFAHLRPVRQETYETTIPGVYAVGDCCGLGGAPAASAEGTIAGTATARSLGLEATEPRTAKASLRRARLFQTALWRLYDRPAQDVATIPDETLLCRCEEVTMGAIRAALADGPAEIGAVKRATRTGMGRCQGRYCGPALVRLIAAQGGGIDERSFFAPRMPVKPVRLQTVLAVEKAIADTKPPIEETAA